MSMMHQRLGPELEAPSGEPKPAAEIEIAAGADALGESPQLIERRAANQEVAGRGAAILGPDQPLGVIEQVPRTCVAGGQRALPRIPEDLAGHRAAAVRDRLLEVGRQQVGGGSAVRVHEQQPSGSRCGRAGVAGVVGGALGRGRDDSNGAPVCDRLPTAPHHPCRCRALAVVGDQDLVVLAELQRRDRRRQAARGTARPSERDHKADRRTSARRSHAQLSPAARSGGPRQGRGTPRPERGGTARRARPTPRVTRSA